MVGKQTSKETYANQKRPTQNTYRPFGLVLGVPGQMCFITLGKRPSKETYVIQKRPTKDTYWRFGLVQGVPGQKWCIMLKKRPLMCEPS